MIAETEKEMILSSLRNFGCDIEKTAEYIGITKEVLIEKIKSIDMRNVRDKKKEIIKKVNRDEKIDGKKKKITISMNKYPELYDKLAKLSHTNIRTIEQQALFYIVQAVGETEVRVKESEDQNDKC